MMANDREHIASLTEKVRKLQEELFVVINERDVALNKLNTTEPIISAIWGICDAYREGHLDG